MTDYAPLYTTWEKFKIIGLQLGWVLPVILFFKYMFLPWLNSTNWFLCSTHGLEISIFGIFIGIPLLLVITTLFNTKQIDLLRKLVNVEPIDNSCNQIGSQTETSSSVTVTFR